MPAPEDLEPPGEWPSGATVDALGLRPTIRWYDGIAASWTPGEDGAHARLAAFLDAGVGDYDTARDLPAEDGVSRLSPYLHFSEISARSVWSEVSARRSDPDIARGAEAYLRELGWREFAHHVLYHFTATVTEPLNKRFERFPWQTGPRPALEAWQRGRTGIPIVDAGMRELWHTGWMHNRVRMIVASLLRKNLRLPWQAGARWFWDTLVAADLASNTQGWLWAAGSGADAAPYLRIFNPVLQGQRFDAAGAYVRRWCPELAALPDKLIHQPWTAKPAVLDALGIRLGHDYPAPAVDLKQSRDAALAAFQQLKQRA